MPDRLDGKSGSGDAAASLPVSVRHRVAEEIQASEPNRGESKAEMHPSGGRRCWVSSAPTVVASGPGNLLDEDSPVFAAPWQAQAFAMALTLQQRGILAWAEWAEMLGAAGRSAGVAAWVTPSQTRGSTKQHRTTRN
jgi:hypothetical protein